MSVSRSSASSDLVNPDDLNFPSSWEKHEKGQSMFVSIVNALDDII